MPTPDFLLRRPSHGNECGFLYKESRMKLVGPAKPYRKSREEELREDHDGPDFDAAITGSRDA